MVAQEEMTDMALAANTNFIAQSFFPDTFIFTLHMLNFILPVLKFSLPVLNFTLHMLNFTLPVLKFSLPELIVTPVALT
jgi:hypothetical protein